MRKWPWISGVVYLLIGFCAGAWAADIAPLDSEDADVQALMAVASEEQQRLEKSGIIYRDQELASYLNRVAARLDAGAVPPSGGFRVKMVKDPHLNAFTYPDGTCYIQTGILARLENEAQLAALLAHELAHYSKHHAENGIRRFHRRLEDDLSHQPHDREASPSRAQVQRHIENMWAGYHHEAEFEADREALKLMIRAGYDAHESLRLFGHLTEEMAREKIREPVKPRSHPRLQARIEKCKQFLKAVNPPSREAVHQVGNFGNHIQSLLLENIALDIQAGRYEQALRASAKFLAVCPGDARGNYLMGEIYRQKGRSASDLARAESYYRRAIDIDSQYPEPYRALGMLYYKTGQSQQARPFLEASLTMTPEAPENAYIRNYLSRIQP